MKLYKNICNTLNKWYDNYTLFSFVAMHGERGKQLYDYHKRHKK